MMSDTERLIVLRKRLEREAEDTQLHCWEELRFRRAAQCLLMLDALEALRSTQDHGKECCCRFCNTLVAVLALEPELRTPAPPQRGPGGPIWEPERNEG